MTGISLNHSELVTQVIRRFHDRPILAKSKFNLLATHVGIAGAVPFGNVNGEEWKQRRKVARRKLATIPSKILKDITNQSLGNHLLPMLVSKIEECENNNSSNYNWYATEDLMWYAFNTIYFYNVGQCIDRNDKFWRQLCGYIDLTFRWMIKSNNLSRWPILLHTSYANKFINLVENRTKMFEQMIQHRQELIKRKIANGEQVERDTYIDYMLKSENDGELTRNEVLADIGMFDCAYIYILDILCGII